MSRAKTGSVSKILKDAIDAEVAEIARKYKEGDTIPAGKNAGEFVYPAIERMRIYDRALKLAGLELKVDDPGFGSNFSKGNK